MGYAAKWLGLVALTAVMVPVAEIPGFFGETRDLMPAAFAQSTEARKAEADRLLQQGIQQFNISQFREALRSWEQALAIYQDIGDRGGEGRALGNLGIAYFSLGDYRQAIAFGEQHLAIARELGDRGGEGNALNNLGAAYLKTEQFALAETALAQALDVWDALRDALKNKVPTAILRYTPCIGCG